MFIKKLFSFIEQIIPKKLPKTTLILHILPFAKRNVAYTHHTHIHIIYLGTFVFIFLPPHPVSRKITLTFEIYTHIYIY